jgi:hypothetical protein
MNEHSNPTGPILIIASLLLLMITGKLTLLLVLIPASVFLGYGLWRLGGHKTGLTNGIKKG